MKCQHCNYSMLPTTTKCPFCKRTTVGVASYNLEHAAQQFKDNPDSQNYNLMLMAMGQYQYHKQKFTEDHKVCKGYLGCEECYNEH